MRFLLYNLRYCAGTGITFHVPFPWIGYLRPTTRVLERVTEFIGAQQPDIAGLVEVDTGSFRTGKENQAEYIARALGHFHCYKSKYAEDSVIRALPVMRRQVNAFLTRDTIMGEKFHYFDKGIKRLVIELDLQDLTIFLVHLSVKFRHRHDQLRALCEMIRKVRRPHIVAGDFNPLWGDRELDLFLAATGLTNANREGLPSYPSRAPRRQLDFVLHGPGIVVERFEVPRVEHSDHLPVICDFRVEPLPDAPAMEADP
jgi:endonuclease/exonuclease/phosphatase family metal-dependent hydrolase